MAPLVVVAVVAVGLFGTGTVVKPHEPVLGTTLQVAGVGTLIGGGIGAAAGAGSGLATALGTTTVASTVGTAAVIGGVAGAGVGFAVAPRGSNPQH
jgi:hypothetical protein